MNKTDRKRLISKIAVASGVAKYAIEDRITKAKMSDDDLIKLSQHLDILKLIKPANDYNRHCQGNKTGEAKKETEEVKAQLKEFMDLNNSELIKAGKWLLSAFSKKGEERKEHLLEKDLVHKEDYNESITDLTDVIETQQQGLKEQIEIAKEKIQFLEEKNDTYRKQLNKIKNYISINLGSKVWEEIRKYIAS